MPNIPISDMSKSAKSTSSPMKKARDRQSEIAKEQWRGDKLRNAIIEKQTIKYSDKMLQFVSNRFKDGMSALDAFNKDPGLFDLIVTDMAMPKMTGAEFSVKILDIRKDIPIILCTGYSDNFDAEMAHEIGIKQYVQKPVIWKDLSAHIRELLDQN